MRLDILSVVCAGLCVCGCSKNDTNLSRMDLKVYQDNKTGEIIFIGRPTKIIDGDTIVLARSIKIRMVGIDAPESYQKCTDENGDEYKCGAAATQHLRDIIGTERIKCRLHASDKYGRQLMTCYKPDGTDIHAQMVHDGYAVVSPYEPTPYLTEEQDARENRRGIWQGRFQHPHCRRHKKNWKVENLCDNNKNYTGWDTAKYKSAK